VRYILLLTVVLASNAFAAPDFDETMAEANQGAAYAQFNLGVMYDNGEGVPENDAEAVRWFRKAADQGHTKAQFNLGTMYDNGEGVPENHVRAYVWLSMAKTQGYERAKKWVETVKNLMTKQQIAQAQAQALASQCYESDYKDCD
jgi:TPR repeat protein